MFQCYDLLCLFPYLMSLLAQLVPETHRTPRAVVADTAAAEEFLDDAIARGHEGVMLKALDQPYAATARVTSAITLAPQSHDQ